MSGIPQCWYGLLLVVDRRDPDIVGISISVCGTSSSMHVHHEPSLSHTMFPYVFQRTDWICFELIFRFRHIDYLWLLMTWNCWWSDILFRCKLLKRTISSFREIELIWVKAVAIKYYRENINGGEKKLAIFLLLNLSEKKLVTHLITRMRWHIIVISHSLNRMTPWLYQQESRSSFDPYESSSKPRSPEIHTINSAYYPLRNVKQYN